MACGSTSPSAAAHAGRHLFDECCETRQPIVANNRAEQAALGMAPMPGTDQSQSSVDVPILGGDRVLGMIVLEDYERENAYGESEVRLLSTVAASMGVALENARLFDETQRLFKETEQRAAELAIINSVQEGLAAAARLPGDRRPRRRQDARDLRHRGHVDRAGTTGRATSFTMPVLPRARRALSDRAVADCGRDFTAHVIRDAPAAGHQRRHGAAHRRATARA